MAAPPTSARRALRASAERRRRASRAAAAAGAATALVLGMIPAFGPPHQPTAAEQRQAYVESNAQTLTVAARTEAVAVDRDPFDATAGYATYIEGGTNHDWAKLVLLMAGFPITDNNVTVFTRWMRQENGPPDWWNRNNPLNNGWGSGGGGGLGRYDSLVTAAENAAKALHGNPGYHEIVAAFSQSAPTEVTERAIWFSPWASGHYNNGKHWSYVPVPVVKAPASSWQ